MKAKWIGGILGFVFGGGILGGIAGYALGSLFDSSHEDGPDPTHEDTPDIKQQRSRNNFLFSLIVFAGFAPIFWDGFCWTVLQCATCALTGAVAELIMEILFSPIGYRITKTWRAQNVGREYFDYTERTNKA